MHRLHCVSVCIAKVLQINKKKHYLALGQDGSGSVFLCAARRDEVEGCP